MKVLFQSIMSKVGAILYGKFQLDILVAELKMVNLMKSVFREIKITASQND